MLKKIDEADVSFNRWPRTLTEAFGPNAKLTVLEERTWVQEGAEYVGYAAAGLVVGACCVFGLLGAYRILFTAW